MNPTDGNPSLYLQSPRSFLLPNPLLRLLPQSLEPASHLELGFDPPPSDAAMTRNNAPSPLLTPVWPPLRELDLPDRPRFEPSRARQGARAPPRSITPALIDAHVDWRLPVGARVGGEVWGDLAGAEGQARTPEPVTHLRSSTYH
jgi:hypothetical protein